MWTHVSRVVTSALHVPGLIRSQNPKQKQMIR